MVEEVESWPGHVMCQVSGASGSGLTRAAIKSNTFRKCLLICLIIFGVGIKQLSSPLLFHNVHPVHQSLKVANLANE